MVNRLGRTNAVRDLEDNSDVFADLSIELFKHTAVRVNAFQCGSDRRTGL